MNTTNDTLVSNKRLWASRVLGGLAIAFLTFDAVIKLARLAPAVAGTVQLGYPPGVVLGIGLVEICARSPMRCRGRRSSGRCC